MAKISLIDFYPDEYVIISGMTEREGDKYVVRDKTFEKGKVYDITDKAALDFILKYTERIPHSKTILATLDAEGIFRKVINPSGCCQTLKRIEYRIFKEEDNG